MICSLDFASADSNRPRLAEATQVAAMVTNNSNDGLPSATAPGVGPPAPHHDRDHDRRLQHGEQRVHAHLRQQVGRRGQAHACSRRKIGLSPIRSRMVRCPEHRADVEGRPGSVPARSGTAHRIGDSESDIAGYHQRQHPMMNGNSARKRKIGAVGDDQAGPDDARSSRTGAAGSLCTGSPRSEAVRPAGFPELWAAERQIPVIGGLRDHWRQSRCRPSWWYPSPSPIIAGRPAERSCRRGEQQHPDHARPGGSANG